MENEQPQATVVTPTIVYFITDSGVGGTEKTVLSILRHINRKIVVPRAVIVLKRKREMAAEWEKTGVPIFELGFNKWPTPFLWRRITGLLRETKPAIVHAFLYHSIQLTRLARAFNPSFKLVTSPRVNYRFAPKWALSIDRRLKHLDDRTVCESEASRKSLIETLGYAPEKTMVAWNSVDSEKYRSDLTARKRIRAEFGVSESDILIGAVGRLHHQKGLDVLVKAFERLKDGPVSFKGVIVGKGPQEATLKKFTSEHGLPVMFPGERGDVEQILSALDIFVQSSRYEGLSNALLEAMSCGRSCIATAVDGTLDFAKDGENMLLVKPEDDVSLAVALGLLLERPALRIKLAQNATITTREFSVERMIQGFEQAYRSVLSKS